MPRYLYRAACGVSDHGAARSAKWWPGDNGESSTSAVIPAIGTQHRSKVELSHRGLHGSHVVITGQRYQRGPFYKRQSSTSAPNNPRIARLGLKVELWKPLSPEKPWRMYEPSWLISCYAIAKWHPAPTESSSSAEQSGYTRIRKDSEDRRGAFMHGMPQSSSYCCGYGQGLVTHTRPSSLYTSCESIL